MNIQKKHLRECLLIVDLISNKTITQIQIKFLLNILTRWKYILMFWSKMSKNQRKSKNKHYLKVQKFSKTHLNKNR